MRIHALILLALLASCGGVPVLSDLTDQGFDFDVRVEGNESLSGGDVARAVAFDLAEFESQEHSRAAADDVAFALRIQYRERGFRLAEVDYEVEQSEEGTVLVLRVTEGPRTLVDEEGLVTSGFTVFSREQVVIFFNGPRVTGLAGLRHGPLLFIAAGVSSVPGKIVDEYIHRGYLDAQVDPVEITFSEDGKLAQLSIVAREGPRHRVGRVRLAPGTREVVDPTWLQQLFDRYRNFEGERRVFDPRLPFELRGELRERLASQGRPDSAVRVTTEIDAEASGGPRVDLLVTMEPGPIVTVGTLHFEGNEVTRTKFLHSRLRLAPGDLFASRAARESLRRLYSSGLFKSVDMALIPRGDESGDEVVRDLVFTVEEASTREYFIEPGYGSYEGLRLRVGARERNLQGTGRQLRTELTAAMKATRAEIVLTDPWLFGRDLIGDLPLQYEDRENPSFTERTLAIGALATKEWGGPKVSTTFGYKYERSEVLDVDVVDSEVLDALENINLSSLVLTQRFDRRDSVLMPNNGSVVEGTLEWGDRAIGSQLDFLRVDLTFKYYQQLIEDELVLASAFRTGVIAPQGEDDSIPLQERYFNGGENTVRSFEEDALGPKDSQGNALGGEARTVLNLELRKRLGASVEAALFADAGNVSADASDWLSFKDVRAGVGVGLRYLLPIGPIRVDLGWNPDMRPGEDEFVTHVALGISF